MFISVSPPILKLPVEFNDLLKTVLESTNTTTVDLSYMLVFAVFPLLPLSAPKLILIFSPLFFLVQKMEGPVKLRTVREAPTDCVCPPGKWMFDCCWRLTSIGLVFSLLSTRNCQGHGQENHRGFQAVCGTLWTVLGPFFLHHLPW